MTTVGNRIRARLETLTIAHPAYSECQSALMETVTDTLEGREPSIEFLLGPSRCGKTELLRSIESRFPRKRENGTLIVPVLYVSVRSCATLKALPLSIMRALEAPAVRHRESFDELCERMYRQLRLSKVIVILLDEASHLVEEGKRAPCVTTADFFKEVFSIAGNISLVFAGIPRLRELLEASPQLRYRSRAPLELMPYRWDLHESRLAFAGCVKQCISIFEEEGCPPMVPLGILAAHLYAVSAGHIGLLLEFLKSTARSIKEPQPLTLQVFKPVCEQIPLPGDGMQTPFLEDPPTDTQLQHVLASELRESYGLTLPSGTAWKGQPHANS